MRPPPIVVPWLEVATKPRTMKWSPGSAPSGVVAAIRSWASAVAPGASSPRAIPRGASPSAPPSAPSGSPAAAWCWSTSTRVASTWAVPWWTRTLVRGPSGPGAFAQVAELDVEDVRRGDPAGVGEQVAAREVVDRDAAEVDRRAVAGDRAVDRRAVDLDAADPRGEAARQHRELVAEPDRAAEHRPGDDRPEALDREHAVDRQAEHAGRLARRHLVDRGGDRGAQVVEPGARCGSSTPRSARRPGTCRRPRRSRRRSPSRATRRRPGRAWSAPPGRGGRRAARRCRGARGSAASRPRRPRSPGTPGPGRSRPATIDLTNRSWPGTSTTAIRRSPRSSRANPSSVVMPRAFSTGRRSVSMPVSARTSDVLPWSIWPAVPRTIGCDTPAPYRGGGRPAGRARAVRRITRARAARA